MDNKKRVFVIMPFSKTIEHHTEQYWMRHFNSYLKPLIERNENLEAFRSHGELLRKGLTDYETVSSMPVVVMWEKLLPFVEGARKAYNDPSWWANFEYFYNEAKKRQLKYQQSKA